MSFHTNCSPPSPAQARARYKTDWRGLSILNWCSSAGATRGRLQLQARSGAGCRIQHAAAQRSTAIACAHRRSRRGRFPDRVAREPELLAHHFTEACQIERAVGYWLKAGERAAQRSANLEAIRHLTRGLEALNTLPESFERDRQELAFQIAIGTPMIAVHGYSAPQTGAAYSRARALCERLGEAEPLVATLSGEFVYYFVRGDYSMMRRLTDEARQVAERLPSPLVRLASHRLAGITAMHFGAFAEARSEFEAILRLYDAASASIAAGALRSRPESFGPHLSCACPLDPGLSRASASFEHRGVPLRRGVGPGEPHSACPQFRRRRFGRTARRCPGRASSCRSDH